MPCSQHCWEVLDVKIGVRIDNINTTLLKEFADFTEKVLGLSEATPREVSRR